MVLLSSHLRCRRGRRKQTFGRMVPITYVQELTTCELIEILVQVRMKRVQRYFVKGGEILFKATAFGGNRADYEEKIKSIDGVGA